MRVRSLVAVVVLCTSAIAAAQPMMMDPSKMSGIPRPDPQVPPQTITVRLIRGTLANRVVGTDVALTGADDKSRTVKTDAEGRATFSSLEGEGPFVASAKDGETELKSQPIPLTAQMGSRVMLVFPVTGAGTADGVGHPDKTLPAGTILVRAEDASGQAQEGLQVHLGHARAGETKVDELNAKTDVAGEAKFEGQDRKPTSGYLIEVVAADGTRFAGKPFKLEENVGSRVVITIHTTTKDTSQVTIAEGSHLQVEVTDDSLQVGEVFRLHNASGASLELGSAGLHIPLPRNSVSAQALDANPNFSIVGHDAVWLGPLPPGDTQLRVGFVLPYTGDRVELVQPTPIPFTRIAMVTQRLEGLEVAGHDMHGEPREMQGHKLTVYFGGETTRGGELHLTFTGLPHTDPMPRYAAAIISVALILVFAIYAAMGDGGRRTRLERERRESLEELVQIEDELGLEKASESQHRKLTEQREKLAKRLAVIYRDLDELGGG